jgi:hypothetical protein
LLVCFKLWYKSQRPGDADEQAVLDGTNEMRVRTEKRDPLQSESTFTVRGIRVPKDQVERFVAFMSRARNENLPIRLKRTIENLEMAVGDEKFACPVTEVLIDRRLPEFPEANILDICEKYYDMLASLVRACEQEFGAKLSAPAPSSRGR